MQSPLKYSFSYTRSTTTTCPSATDVTRDSSPSVGLRFGILWNQRTKNANSSSTAKIGHSTHGFFINNKRTMAISATTAQIEAIVPFESLSITNIFLYLKKVEYAEIKCAERHRHQGAVKTVQQASVSGNDIPGILDAIDSLPLGLKEITINTRHRHYDGEDD